MCPCQKNSFAMVEGMIVGLNCAATGERRLEGCVTCAMVEDDNGNIVNFVITPDTFVVDWETLTVGKRGMFWYRTDAPAPLIEPPQYMAAVAALAKNDRMIQVGYYDSELVNEDHTLQLILDGSEVIRTTNNQYFQGDPAEHDLVVIYGSSTRSIPAQTTPQNVIVLCGNLFGE